MKPEIYLAARNYIKAIPKKDGAVSEEIYSEAIKTLAPILKNMNDGTQAIYKISRLESIVLSKLKNSS